MKVLILYLIIKLKKTKFHSNNQTLIKCQKNQQYWLENQLKVFFQFHLQVVLFHLTAETLQSLCAIQTNFDCNLTHTYVTVVANIEVKLA